MATLLVCFSLAWMLGAFPGVPVGACQTFISSRGDSCKFSYTSCVDGEKDTLGTSRLSPENSVCVPILKLGECSTGVYVSPEVALK